MRSRIRESGPPAAEGAEAASRRPGRPSSRSRILAAAADLIGEVGAANVSLEAVAERAGVSKGGLLYNFPSKVTLLKALVAEHLLDLDIRRADAEAALDGGANRCARAFVAAMERHVNEPKPTGFLAALAESPELLDPLRAHHEAMTRRFREAEDPTLCLVAFLAVEGLKSLDLFEANPLGPEERAAVLRRLEALLAG